MNNAHDSHKDYSIALRRSLIIGKVSGQGGRDYYLPARVTVLQALAGAAALTALLLTRKVWIQLVPPFVPGWLVVVCTVGLSLVLGWHIQNGMIEQRQPIHYLEAFIRSKLSTVSMAGRSVKTPGPIEVDQKLVLIQSEGQPFVPMPVLNRKAQQHSPKAIADSTPLLEDPSGLWNQLGVKI